MKMKFTGCLISGMLLVSCGSKSLQHENTVRLNRSALYDPPMITLIEGTLYTFSEGSIQGEGQKFFSHHAYKRALAIGESGQ